MCRYPTRQKPPVVSAQPAAGTSTKASATKGYARLSGTVVRIRTQSTVAAAYSATATHMDGRRATSMQPRHRPRPVPICEAARLKRICPAAMATGKHSSSSSWRAGPAHTGRSPVFDVQQVAADDFATRIRPAPATMWRRKLCGYGKKCTCGLNVNRYSRSSGTMTSRRRRGHAAQLGNGAVDMQHVFEHVCADDRCRIRSRRTATVRRPPRESACPDGARRCRARAGNRRR